MRALTVLIALAAPGSALAQQPTPTLRCNVDASDVDFGQYSTIDSFATFANGRVIVDCSRSDDTPVRVTISAGNSGNPLDRAMTGGGQEILYNLYVDPGRHTVAGDGTQGTSPLIPRLSREGRTIYLLFGTIPAEQAVEAGRYSDRLRVDVEF